DLLEELFAALLHVVGKTQRARHRQQLAQERLANSQRQRAQVEFLPRQEIEREQRRGILQAGPLDVDRAKQLAPLLQPLKAGVALPVERHHLSVEGEGAKRKLGHGGRNLGKQPARVAPAPEYELRTRAVLAGEQSISVVLELEQPARRRKWLVSRLGE